MLERNQELDQIKTDLRKNNTIVTEQAKTIQNMADEKVSLNELIEKLTNEKQQLVSNQQIMEEELKMSKDKINAAEECKEMLHNQLRCVTDELEESKQKMSVHYNVSNDLTDRLAQIEFEKATNDEVGSFEFIFSISIILHYLLLETRSNESRTRRKVKSGYR